MTIELFKTFDSIGAPDPRNTNVFTRDDATGEVSRFTLAELHKRLSDCTLNAAVPEDIQNHFLTARHLALYSWFVYRFEPVAQMQAFASLEFALRKRLGYEAAGERGPTLAPLLKEAVKLRLLMDERFRDWPGHFEPHWDGTSATAWLEGDALEYLTTMRNEFAHGSFTLFADGGRALRMSADGINQLFD